MDRTSWLQAAQYLMDGFFQNIHSMEDAPLCTRTEMEVTYPHLRASQEQQAREEKAEVFEGLTRSLFIAGGLIANDPKAAAGGILLRDYYAKWILKVVDPRDPWFVGSYSQMQALCDGEDPIRPFQQTVETCALVIGLWMTNDDIWEVYTVEEKEKIAAFLQDWAMAPTVPQNWRLFNMLDLAFLSLHGYEIDETVMHEHAEAILMYTVGDGWYRDGQSFDFYSCWAFNVYAPLWCKWYGYEHAPRIAARFEACSNKLMETYPRMFDADGWTLLWGRSSIYRNAATSAFDGNFFLNNPKVDPGLARRIASGSLLQFITRDDFLANGVPSIGFYGPFTPLVQGYSCAESVYWIGKAFLCLALPAEHPYWTARENNGKWNFVDRPEVVQATLNGPALAITNHQQNGETILRTGKVVKAIQDRGGQWEYGKLCYNSKYPWESQPIVDGEIETAIGAQEYILTYQNGDSRYGNVTLWSGEKHGILYRRKFFSWDVNTETHWVEAIDLADFPLPYGIMRCDRLRLVRKPVTITLGSYGFPDNKTKVIRKSQDGAKAIILQGRDHMGRARQLAMTIWGCWMDLNVLSSEGTNPDGGDSIIIYAETHVERIYDASEPHALISQVITKETLDEFTDEELFPIEEIKFADHYRTGAGGPITIKMKDRTEKIVDFEGIEGRLMV